MLEKIGHFVGSLFVISIGYLIVQLVRWCFGADVDIVVDLIITGTLFVIMSIIALILAIFGRR